MNKENQNSQIFMNLGIMYVTCLLLSNLIAGKLTAIGSFSVPASIILFPITYIFGDLFTEVYGFAKAKRIIWMGFFCNFAAVAVYMITIALPHPEFFTAQDAYATVLGTTPRVALASFIGYLFGQFSNSVVLSKLKVATNGKHLWARMIGSTAVGEAFDSFIFISIAFFGTMSNKALLTMILTQYVLKVLYEVVFTPLTYKVVAWIKNKEQLDHYDYDVKYSVVGSEE